MVGWDNLERIAYSSNKFGRNSFLLYVYLQLLRGPLMQSIGVESSQPLVGYQAKYGKVP